MTKIILLMLAAISGLCVASTLTIEPPKFPEHTPIPELVVKLERKNDPIDLIYRTLYDKEYFKVGMKNKELTDVECLALAIYGEARGESERGRLAVAFVINNRLDKWDLASHCAVVRERGQFGFKTNYPHKLGDKQSWRDSVLMASNLIDNDGFNDLQSPIAGALYFNSVDMQETWKNKKYVTKIGDHYFYK